MNSTLLRFLAVLLALGAIATAAIGYRLSKQSTPVVAPAPPKTYAQVVAARDVPTGQLLTAQDVRLEAMPNRDIQGFETINDVIGKLTTEPLVAGTPVLARHFPRLGQAAQALRPGERGVAIKVTEVVGVGGFVTPGDHVDVLLYLRGSKETSEITSAQVVLRDVRVIAYGEALENAEESPTTLQKVTAEANPDTRHAAAPKKEQEKGKSSRSAILAVPEKEASRLMLAESSGQIRLALRGAEPPNLAVPPEEAARQIRLAELAGAAMPRPSAAPATATRTAVARPAAKKTAGTPSKKTATSTASTTRVIVHRGDQVEVVAVQP